MKSFEVKAWIYDVNSQKMYLDIKDEWYSTLVGVGFELPPDEVESLYNNVNYIETANLLVFNYVVFDLQEAKRVFRYVKELLKIAKKKYGCQGKAILKKITAENIEEFEER